MGRAYGNGGYGGGYQGYGSPQDQAARTQMKREREIGNFFRAQRRIIEQGGEDELDDAHWARIERRVFGANHVKAGINFAKYDSIEVVAEGGTGREQPISSRLGCKYSQNEMLSTETLQGVYVGYIL